MKKIGKIALSILLIAGLLAPCLSFANATTPSNVSGYWIGVFNDPTKPMTFTNAKISGANLFGDVSNYGIYKAGDIIGNFYQEFKLAQHFKDPKLVEYYLTNHIDGKLWEPVSFEWTQMVRHFEGTVKIDGITYSGGFTMLLQATGTGNNQNPNQAATWTLEGTWTIIDGTGGLEGLHGQGSWWHHAGGTGLSYEGQVHIDP